MANLSYLFYSAPRAGGILVSRLIILALSTTALALFATTLHVYKTSSAPTDSLAPLNDSLLVTNAVPIVPLTISIVWSITQLTLLTRRILRMYRRNSGGLATVGEEKEARDRETALVYPGWDVGVDFLCWVFLVVVTVLTGVEVGNWKAGQLGDGSGGTRQVDLKACPSFDPTTGMLDYWCGQAWNRLVDLTSDGMNIMGTTAYVHIT
jgi:hypothetical protein